MCACTERVCVRVCVCVCVCVHFNHIIPTLRLEEPSNVVSMATGPSGRLDSKD